MLLGIDQLCALNPKRPTSNREILTHRDGKKGELLPTQWSCKESLDGYTEDDKTDYNSRLELYKQGKPYREEVKK